MVSVVRKTEKTYNGNMNVELKKAPVFVYWQAFMNRPK